YGGNALIVSSFYSTEAEILLYISNDGVNWNLHSQDTPISLFGIASNSDLLIAVGEKSNIFYSTDGLNWGLINLLDQLQEEYSFLDVIYYDNKFIIVGTDGLIIYSTDGFSWEIANSQIDNNLVGITAINDKYIAFGNGGKNCYIKKWYFMGNCRFRYK
ncbi:MAG: hypothetical protein OMM_12364, partial [Candidatus Magnetoglobus multicellularis str. Araruama]